MSKRKVRIKMGAPVVVAQADLTVRQWGEFQFPTVLERLPDGQLHVSFTQEGHRDSAADYGKPLHHCISHDSGETWLKADEQNLKPIFPGGWSGGGGPALTITPNGDWLLPNRRPSIKADDLQLPKPISEDSHLFMADDFPQELAGWRIFRKPAGSSQWTGEYPEVNIPGALRGVIAADIEVNIVGEIRRIENGILPFPSFDFIYAISDGSLLSPVQFNRRLANGHVQHDLSVGFLSSHDNGHSWELLSIVDYTPDKRNDPTWEAREKLAWHEGFCEPGVTFLPDGSILCLMRTTSGSTIIGPLYWMRSKDNGRTWSAPEIFDDIGVWPRMVTLGNGVTLACYGRPGFHLRASADPSGLDWDERFEVIRPAPNRNNCCWHNMDTCGYGSLLALDDQTALLVYSDFEYPSGPCRVACKTILSRQITTQKA